MLKTETTMNFESDIRENIKSEFDYLGINYKFTDDLDKDLMNFFTINKKYIHQWPRKVELSIELQSKIDQKEKYYDVILHLKELLEKGENINRHQSSELFNHYVNDHLIYDWNIYHLHLSTKRTHYEYFNDRTKKILFTYIDEEKALFLDIDNHPPKDVFADKKLLEILDRNWQGMLNEVDGIVGLPHNLNKSERFLFRKKGINEGIIEINGKFVFAPGLGVVSSGHSSEVRLMLNHFRRWLVSNENAIKENKESVDFMFKNQLNIKNEINYKLIFTQNGPEIWDSNSGKKLIKYKELIQIE